MVLFSHSPAERAAATGTPKRTIYRQIARFAQLGMASFVPPPKVERHRTPPPLTISRGCGPGTEEASRPAAGPHARSGEWRACSAR